MFEIRRKKSATKELRTVDLVVLSLLSPVFGIPFFYLGQVWSALNDYPFHKLNRFYGMSIPSVLIEIVAETVHTSIMFVPFGIIGVAAALVFNFRYKKISFLRRVLFTGFLYFVLMCGTFYVLLMYAYS